MTVFVLTSDDQAASVLCAAIRRAGEEARWICEAEALPASTAPADALVLVVDAAVAGYERACARIGSSSVFVLAEPGLDVAVSGARVVEKPFDAADLATMLIRQLEIARMDRGRRRAEAHAEELASLVQASFEAIVGISPDGTVRSWNPGAVRTYGWTAEEMGGQTLDVLEVGEPAALGPGTRERARRRKDGALVTVVISRSPLPHDTGMVEVSVDVTEHRRLQRAVEHGERLATLGRVAASLAHEVNNPLAVIVAAAEWAAEIRGNPQSADLDEWAQDVAAAAERIQSFVRHVTGFACREAGTPRFLSVQETMAGSLRFVRPRAAKHNVSLVVEDGPQPYLLHETTRLSQAIVNLLSNAIDAAALGGRHVWLRLLLDDDSVRIEVDDDGPGVAPEIADRLFEAFATTKAPGEGTGLGLSIVKDVVNDHGGTVALASRPGGGTRATVVLPIRREAQTPAGKQ